MSKKLSRELIAQKVKSDRIESIRNLNLWGSNIEDISIIEDMPSLEIVSLSVNKIKTLRPFANLANLRELYLRRNLISNLNEIKYLTDCQNLSVLWLSENPICDNPNYRAVIICVLPQLQKLDDIAITDQERSKAEKKLSGNLGEGDDDSGPEPEENMKENNTYDTEDNYYGNNGRQNQNKRNVNQNRNKYDDRDDEQNEYTRPKKTFQQMRSKQNDDYGYNKKKSNDYNDDRYNYDNRPIKGSGGAYGNKNKYKDNYEEDNYNPKKKGNSNVLNCVINLLKELSPSELQMVKREIDRINNY